MLNKQTLIVCAYITFNRLENIKFCFWKKGYTWVNYEHNYACLNTTVQITGLLMN